MDSPPQEQVWWLGLDPDTGHPSRPPVQLAKITDSLFGTQAERREELEGQLQDLVKAVDEDPDDQRGSPPFGVNPSRLDQTGWGVVFATDTDSGVPQALGRLLQHRKHQAGSKFKIFDGSRGLAPGQSAWQWLSQFGLGPGPGSVDIVPYYLLIVGDPKDLPFGVEFDLGSRYAVGRIGFQDLESYERYADSIVRSESRRPAEEHRLALFGMEHGDIASRSSMKNLVRPLLETLKLPEDWKLETYFDEQALKKNLVELLQSSPPSVLFTVGHGLGPGSKSPRWERVGALVCNDYLKGLPLRPQHYLAASDLRLDTDLTGLISFFFGCFTTGIPEYDSFATSEPPARVAPEAQLAPLAEKMLALEQGAAAVLGHMDRALGHSYLWERNHQPYVFKSVLEALMNGHTIGSAIQYLNQRYSDLAVATSRLRESVNPQAEDDLKLLTRYWLAERDARNYLLLGDPAVRAC